MHPDGQVSDGIALCRILVRMGRMQQDQFCTRAGRQERAAELSKPRVVEFIENNRKVVDLLFRTEQVREMDPTLSFNASLIFHSLC